MKALWNKTKTWLNTNNHLLWVSIIALIALGLVGMYFIGPYEAARHNFEPNIFFNKFLPFALIGTAIMFVFSKLSKKWVIRISWILGIIGLLMIIKTIIDPTRIKGSARWVNMGTAYIDPFAMTLPAYIVLMSHWLSKEKTNKTLVAICTTIWTLLIIYAAAIAPYVFMVQVYLFLFIILGFCARKNNSGVYYTGITMLAIFIVMGILAFLWHQHVQYRILHVGDFVTQMSVQAINSSALVGSTPESLTMLSRLPNVISDFMFTGIIAKFGLLIGAFVLVLYGSITRRLLRITKTTKDQFTKILSGGTLGAFAIYVIMALFVAFEMLPTAAYWPFIGFGGTAFLTWSVLFGFVLAMNKNK